MRRWALAQRLRQWLGQNALGQALRPSWHKLQSWRTELQVTLSRLTQREQLLVVGGLAALGLALLLGVVALVTHAISREEHRLQVKMVQLREVLALQSDYKARQKERFERLQLLGRSTVRLVSWVEEAARQAGVDIGQLRPEEGEAGADGIVESRVDLRAAGLSIDRLADFLSHIHRRTSGIVLVRRLKLSRPYRKDTADIEMSLSTYKLKGS